MVPGTGGKTHENDSRPLFPHQVYNMRVAEYHTYFVGCEAWGFSVWAHNSDLRVHRVGGGDEENLGLRPH
jgi:hypothetical protein